MKKLLIYLILIILPFTQLLGQKVTWGEVTNAARTVSKTKFGYDAKVDSKKIVALKDKDVSDTLLFIVPMEQKGFIIMSADKNLPPVLGVCPTGIFTDIKTLPPGLQYLIEKYISNKTNKKEQKITKFSKRKNLEFIPISYSANQCGQYTSLRSCTNAPNRMGTKTWL